MKLFGHPWSINTRKVLAAAAEKGHALALELVMIPKGEHKQPAHLARHPFGKVPVLDDGGFVLHETRAINAYLDRALAGPPLVPDDARGRARVDQWTHIADVYFAPVAQGLLVEGLFRRYLGGEPNAATIEAGRAAIAPVLDIVERRLGEAPYLAGEVFTLADIHWMPYVDYLARLGEEPARGRPRLAAWWARVDARPAWQRVAHEGPQPDEAGMTADVIERRLRAR